MSALTTLFSSMANKIRSKTGGSDTYTPTQMVSAIDDVYDAGVADATTSITPSNASPVSLTANTGYKPTANGYAIASYDIGIPQGVDLQYVPQNTPVIPIGGCYLSDRNVSPCNPSDITPERIFYGDSYFIGNDGYAIESQPQSVTPSDASPVAVSSGGVYIPTAAGYLVESQPSGGGGFYPAKPSTTTIKAFSAANVAVPSTYTTTEDGVLYGTISLKRSTATTTAMSLSVNVCPPNGGSNDLLTSKMSMPSGMGANKPFELSIGNIQSAANARRGLFIPSGSKISFVPSNISGSDVNSVDLTLYTPATS